MISALSSKEDSDRLIRDLMKKTKDLEKQIVGMKQAHADGATALQEALADRAAIAEQFEVLKLERDSADSKYQSLKGKNGKLKEKAAALKGTIQEFETVLQRERAQYRELEDSLEEHQSQARRRQRQLSNDLVLVTQERDGYSEQLVSLRDKISLLSRELAEGEEGGRAKGDLITKLESQLRAAQEDAAAAKTSSSAQIADLEAAVADTAAELEKTKRSLKQELARVTQERDGYKDQVETLRDKVSLLSRDLADNQDNSTSQGNRIASLEEKLRNAESDLATCSSKLHQTDASLLASENEAEEHHKRLDSLQQEVQEASDSHARASKSWMNERQLLIQDRDGFKAQLDSLRDKVSSLSRELAEGTDSHEAQAAEIAQLREKLEHMQQEHAARVAQLQASIASTSEELQQRTDELDTSKSESQRQAAAWKAERAQLVSDRDGYKGQVETLRDKVSALARDLTDTNSSTDERIEQLQSELQSTSDLLEEARGKLLDFEQQAEAAQATMSQLTELNEELKQQHVTAFSAAEAAHSEAKAAWDAERTEIMQERDTFRTKLHESEELVNNLTSQLADVKAQSESRIRELEESLAVMREKVSSHGLSLERLGTELSSERQAHAVASEELAALHTTATQERKAWKADKAMLLCERDGALSQVATLRDKVSCLSRDLATGQAEEGTSTSNAAAPSCMQAEQAVLDASVQLEMQELRRELGEAQAALDAQMPLVEQLQAELVAVQAQAKEVHVDRPAQAAEEELHAAHQQISNLQQELAAVKAEFNAVAGARTSESPCIEQHHLVGLSNSARDIVVTIAQTLGQPEPAAGSHRTSAGFETSVGDVMTTMNAACTVALAAQHAWEAERRSLEERAVQSAATGAMKAAKDASVEKSAMREELLKLQGQIELLEQRETHLAAEQDRAKAQVAALTVELQSTTSEVERASASAESVAAAAIEAAKEREQSNQGLNERLKASEDTIEQLSEQLRVEAEAHAAQLLELERQNATERKHWRIERAHLSNERDGFCGQVDMLRDKIVELSRELADLRSHGKHGSETLVASPPASPDNNMPDFKIGATSNDFQPQDGSVGQSDWPPWYTGTAADAAGSGELGIHSGVPGEQLLAIQDVDFIQQADV